MQLFVLIICFWRLFPIEKFQDRAGLMSRNSQTVIKVGLRQGEFFVSLREWDGLKWKGDLVNVATLDITNTLDTPT